jgi:hypothetical protein
LPVHNSPASVSAKADVARKRCDQHPFRAECGALATLQIMRECPLATKVSFIRRAFVMILSHSVQLGPMDSLSTRMLRPGNAALNLTETATNVGISSASSKNHRKPEDEITYPVRIG